VGGKFLSNHGFFLTDILIPLFLLLLDDIPFPQIIYKTMSRFWIGAESIFSELKVYGAKVMKLGYSLSAEKELGLGVMMAANIVE
jgi:hypothetical protein